MAQDGIRTMGEWEAGMTYPLSIKAWCVQKSIENNIAKLFSYMYINMLYQH